MKREFLIMILMVLLLSNFTISYATEETLTKISIANNMEVYVDLTQKSGIIKIYAENGTTILVDYEIKQTDKGEAIIFTRIFDDYMNISSGERINHYQGYYWKEVELVYDRDESVPASIEYSETTLEYGYAEGTLYLMRAVYYTNKPIIEALYCGYMRYRNDGNYPYSIDESNY